MVNAVDLSQLPPPDIIETLDYEAILADKKARFIAKYPQFAEVINLESEPALKILEDGAYQELILRARYNQEARELLLATATGSNLDHIGITYYNSQVRLLVTAGNALANPPTLDVFENDEEYRYRLSLQPEAYSVAGPRDAFVYHALTASGQVKDAAPVSPYGGTTIVYVLSRLGDGTPSVALLNTVQAALNGETIRPLSEEVLVQAASIQSYNINIGLVMYPGAISEISVNHAIAQLTQYVAYFHRLKGDINESAIKGKAYSAGVKRIVINAPLANIECDSSQAPYCTSIVVNVVGVED